MKLTPPQISMMNWANHRLEVNEIKNHPFFYGCDWENLRYIAPPFVPALSSITDTTYFPTDELGNLPDQLEAVEQVGSDKDLAFLGCVISDCRSSSPDLFSRFTFKRFT